MDKTNFPKITVTVQAEPWAEGHVARFITTRSVPQTPRTHRVITKGDFVVSTVNDETTFSFRMPAKEAAMFLCHAAC